VCSSALAPLQFAEPLQFAGPPRTRASAGARNEPLVVELPRGALPALIGPGDPAAGPPLPALRPRPASILPPPAKPPPPGPRVAWLPKFKPVLATAAPVRPPGTIWPPPPKPLAFNATEWAPAAGPPAQEGPASAREGLASSVVAHGLAPRPEAERAIEVAERDRQPESLDQSAREALLAGDALSALRMYERLASEFPAARAARLGQALALERLGRRAEARAVYQSLLEADPDDLGVKVALLGILAERAPEEALRLLRRLARYHPDDHRLQAQMAMVLARQGELAAAIAASRRAVGLDPANPGYRTNLAVLYDRAGRGGAAIAEYQRALELAILAGTPTVQLDAIAARLQYLRGAQGSAAGSRR
jgi:Flp pilus assembly protein TadD